MWMSAILAAFLAANPLDASRPPALPPNAETQVDSAIRQVLAEDGTPSASVAIVLHGELIYAKAFGSASLSPSRPATAETRYQLASASKSITAQTLLILAADQRLSLDAPIAQWLPDVTDAGRITVRKLLEHMSGLPDHYPQTYPAGPRGKATTPDRILAEWGRHPLLSMPGTNFHYSNLNYLAAGRIAEIVSGRPLFALQQQRIFGPLGMAHVVDLDHVTEATPNVATGYVRIGLAPLEPAPFEGPGWSFGAGQIVTTASDLARWDIGLMKGRLLPRSFLDQEVQVPKLADGSPSPYALGLFVSEKTGRLVWSHVGQGLGFLAVNRIYPKDHAAIVVLTNSTAALSFAHIADRIAYRLLPPTPADTRAMALFAALQTGRIDRAGLTTEFSDYLTPERLRSYRTSLAPLGPLDSLVLRSEQSADGIVTRSYDAEAGGRHLSLTWEERADGHTDDFLVQPSLE